MKKQAPAAQYGKIASLQFFCSCFLPNKTGHETVPFELTTEGKKFGARFLSQVLLSFCRSISSRQMARALL